MTVGEGVELLPVELAKALLLVAEEVEVVEEALLLLLVAVPLICSLNSPTRLGGKAKLHRRKLV